MIDENNICKFADFGSADFFRAQKDDTFSDSVGTYHFFSPEMCDEKIIQYSGRASDVWALGVSLYAMTYNVLPFASENETELFQKILT